MIDSLERRFGRFAIPNLTAILIIGQVAAYLLVRVDPVFHEKIMLIPGKVLDGEFTRLFSFLFLPPGSALIWAFFYWYLFYLMGTALEHYWGTFRFNVFLLIGYVATVAAGFVFPSMPVTNHFVQGTVFLAFAYLNPNFTLMLMFILPVRIKWLAMLTWFFYAITIIFGDWNARLLVAAGTLNFMLFFGRDIMSRMVSGQRFMRNQASRFAQKEPEYFHQCVVCGVTDQSHPSMDFRYCSQCAGDRAYCQDHLASHDHIVDEAEV